MSKPIISFIIPAYNVEPYIEKCVNSIISQYYENIEVIVVNDGSTDRTLAKLESLREIDSRISIINKENNGVSSARNTGILQAKGDFVVFVDGDDYISPDYSDYMLSLIGDDKVDFGLSLNCFTSDKESQSLTDFSAILTPDDSMRLLLSPRIIVGSWNKIFRRSLLLDNNIYFSESLFYGEGLHFIVNAAKRSRKVAVGNRKVYYYRRNNYSSATTKFNIEKLYCGAEALNCIENDITPISENVKEMLDWHKCQFNMGAVVRLITSKQKSQYKTYYNTCLSNVRKHTLQCLTIKGVSIYKKALLIGCCISPKLMALLDVMRRKHISSKSI